jgi:hypothetical protein
MCLCCDNQAKWLLHRHQQQQQRLKEQQLAAWAAEHYAAAVAGRASVTAADASTAQHDSDSDNPADDPAGSSGAAGQQQGSNSAGWRRSRVTGEDATGKASKPIVQPWARMIGREVPLPLSPSAAAAPQTSKWRGAVSGTMAVNKLSALASATAAADGADSAVEQAAAAASGIVLQEVPVMQGDDDTDVPAQLSR